MTELIITAHHKVDLLNSRSDKEVRKLVKDETQLSVRRLDRFTLISLLTVHQLLSDSTIKNVLSEKLSLYSVAEYLSVDLFQSVITDMHNNESIRPFDFIATVGNAANFYLAKAFNIKGSNIFIGASEQPMLKSCILAEVDLSTKCSEQAIIVLWEMHKQSLCCHAFVVQLSDLGIETTTNTDEKLMVDEVIQSKMKLPLPYRVSTSF